MLSHIIILIFHIMPCGVITSCEKLISLPLTTTTKKKDVINKPYNKVLNVYNSLTIIAHKYYSRVTVLWKLLINKVFALNTRRRYNEKRHFHSNMMSY